jgi:UDP-3-O-[3-hydroxymyristoyl] glucosamine N-acyltransferase
VKDDVPPGARMAGTPAQPFGDFARELAVIKRLVREARGRNDTRKNAES